MAYYIYGNRIPGVTTIISSQCGWSKASLLAWSRREAMGGNDPNEIAETAAGKGTSVHRQISRWVLECIAAGKLVDSSELCIRPFEAWVSRHDLQLTGSELSLTDSTLLFGGTLDLICRYGKKVWLVDIKTSKGQYSEHILQVAAYRHLWEVNRGPVDQVHILYLDGGWDDLVLTDEQLSLGWSAFEHLRALYEIQKNLKRLKD